MTQYFCSIALRLHPPLVELLHELYFTFQDQWLWLRRLSHDQHKQKPTTNTNRTEQLHDRCWVRACYVGQLCVPLAIGTPLALHWSGILTHSCSDRATARFSRHRLCPKDRPQQPLQTVSRALAIRLSSHQCLTPTHSSLFKVFKVFKVFPVSWCSMAIPPEAIHVSELKAQVVLTEVVLIRSHIQFPWLKNPIHNSPEVHMFMIWGLVIEPSYTLLYYTTLYSTTPLYSTTESYDLALRDNHVLSDIPIVIHDFHQFSHFLIYQYCEIKQIYCRIINWKGFSSVVNHGFSLGSGKDRIFFESSDFMVMGITFTSLFYQESSHFNIMIDYILIKGISNIILQQIPIQYVRNANYFQVDQMGVSGYHG